MYDLHINNNNNVRPSKMAPQTRLRGKF